MKYFPIFDHAKHLRSNILKYPDYMNFLESKYDSNIDIIEKIWLYQNGLDNKPLCKFSECSNQVKFIKFSIGYNSYCSKSCSACDTHKDDNIKNKRISGLIQANNDLEIRQEMTIKANETKSHFSDIKKNDINISRSKTVLKNFGIDNIAKLRRKIKNKNTKKKRKLVDNIRNKGFIFNAIQNDILNLTCGNCTCDKNNFNIDRGLFFRRSLTNIEPCINLNPINGGKSRYEFEIKEMLEKYGIIVEHSKYFKFINKRIQLDLYLVDYNFGIEINGSYWHDIKFRPKDYHINKSQLFYENNIDVIHIWEFEMIDIDKIVSLILRRINLIIVSDYNNIYLTDNVLKLYDMNELLATIEYNKESLMVESVELENYKNVDVGGILTKYFSGYNMLIDRSKVFTNSNVVDVLPPISLYDKNFEMWNCGYHLVKI